jgi:hypothetical protein
MYSLFIRARLFIMRHPDLVLALLMLLVLAIIAGLFCIYFAWETVLVGLGWGLSGHMTILCLVWLLEKNSPVKPKDPNPKAILLGIIIWLGTVFCMALYDILFYVNFCSIIIRRYNYCRNISVYRN